MRGSVRELRARRRGHVDGLDNGAVEEDTKEVDPLLEALATLWRESGAGADLRLIGGLAVQLHAGAGARITRDIDVVAMTDSARERLLQYLVQAGWVVGTSGGWWRAARSGPSRLLVDIARHPVVNPRTFDTVSLYASPRRQEIGGVLVSVAGVSDLVTLKLLAMRDQDLVDLVFLAALAPSAREVAHNAAADDIERPLSAGANWARHALRSGHVRELFEQSLSRTPEEEALSSLWRLLAELEREGI